MPDKIINPATGEVKIAHAKPKAKPAKKSDSRPRDINEDDDGYHPYSDRTESTPMYEENPWR